MHIKSLTRSADYHASKVRALVKYGANELGARRYTIRLDSGTEAAILLPESYYSFKRSDFEYYARVLNASLVTVRIAYFLERASIRRLARFREFYLWSDAHLLAKYVIGDLELPDYGYDVIQHGDFPTEDSYIPVPIQLEWRGTRARRYWVWSERGIEAFQQGGTARHVEVIGRPPPRKRVLVPGIGFGCRGPEYFAADISYLLSVFRPCELTVFFHPSCKVHSRILFLLLLRTRGYRAYSGVGDTVTSKFASLSRSFLTEAELAGASRIGAETFAS